ncbi:MAG TPA: hypothetical protein VII33_04420 [Nakamurella sp.]
MTSTLNSPTPTSGEGILPAEGGTATPGAAVAASDAAVTGATTSDAAVTGASESSILPRIVAILTPFFAIAAAGFASWVGKNTGVVVDQGQITVLMSFAATAALAAAWKWMQGWQQHERLVALGRDVPRKPGPQAPANTATISG